MLCVSATDEFFSLGAVRSPTRWYQYRKTVDFNGQWRAKFKVDYRASGARSPSDGVYIDDIMVTKGACPSELSCDFERDECLWTDETEGDSGWSRVFTGLGGARTAASPNLTADGVPGAILLTSSSSNFASRATYVSPNYRWPDNTDVACFKLWTWFTGGDQSLDVVVNKIPAKSE